MTEDSAPESADRAEPVDQTASAAKRRSLPWIIAIGVLVLAGIGVGAAALMGAFDRPAAEAAPVATTQETTQPPRTTPTPSPTPEPEPLPDPSIVIDSVQHMPYSEVWNPPDQGQYVWQIVDPAYGYPETGGTRYILAHACETQECVGDSFRTLEEGDTLTFLGQTYQVQESREIMKVDIAAQDIWTHDPNRLVIITCIIDTTWDQSDRNEILIATRVS